MIGNAHYFVKRSDMIRALSAGLVAGLLVSPWASAQSYEFRQQVKGLKAENVQLYDSCKSILDAGESRGDGIYTIDPTGTSPFDVQCDMTTNGGGWTGITRSLTQNVFNVGYTTHAGKYQWVNDRWFVGDVTAGSYADVAMKIWLPFEYRSFFTTGYKWKDASEVNGDTFDISYDGRTASYSEGQDANTSSNGGDITFGTYDNVYPTASVFAERGLQSQYGTTFRGLPDGKIYDNGVASNSLVIRGHDSGPQDEDAYIWYEGIIWVR